MFVHARQSDLVVDALLAALVELHVAGDRADKAAVGAEGRGHLVGLVHDLISLLLLQLDAPGGVVIGYHYRGSVLGLTHALSNLLACGVVEARGLPARLLDDGWHVNLDFSDFFDDAILG